MQPLLSKWQPKGRARLAERGNVDPQAGSNDLDASHEGFCHCGAVHWREARSGIGNGLHLQYLPTLWRFGAAAFLDERIAVRAIHEHICGAGNRLSLTSAGNGVRRRLAAAPGADGRRHGAINLRLVTDPASVQAISLVHHDTVSMADLPSDDMCVADVWARTLEP